MPNASYNSQDRGSAEIVLRFVSLRDESRLTRKDENGAKPEGRQKVAHGVSRGVAATHGEPPDGGVRLPPAMFAQWLLRPCSGAIRFPAYPHGLRRGLFSVALTGSAAHASQAIFERGQDLSRAECARRAGALAPDGFEAIAAQGLKPLNFDPARHDSSRAPIQSIFLMAHRGRGDPSVPEKPLFRAPHFDLAVDLFGLRQRGHLHAGEACGRGAGGHAPA